MLINHYRDPVCILWIPHHMGFVWFGLKVIWLKEDPLGDSNAEHNFHEEFQSVAGNLLGQLYDFNVRWKIAPPDAFHIPDHMLPRLMNGLAMDDGESFSSNDHSRCWNVLNHAPCLIPFSVSADTMHELSVYRPKNGLPFCKAATMCFPRTIMCSIAKKGLNLVLPKNAKSAVSIRLSSQHHVSWGLISSCACIISSWF